MLISDRHQFIFIHIWKVAGTSITDALADYAYNPDSFLLKRILKKLGVNSQAINQAIANLDRYHLIPTYAGFSIHAQAKSVKKKLPQEVYQKYFKFAFVRNPWDWQVSLYHYILKKQTHYQHNVVKSLGSFENFLDWQAKTQPTLQKDFVTDECGNLIVDFIGKYENLQEDFQTVSQKLNLDIELPYLNSSDRQNYRDYYNENTRKAIENLYREDIELFGYDF